MNAHGPLLARSVRSAYGRFLAHRLRSVFGRNLAHRSHSWRCSSRVHPLKARMHSCPQLITPKGRRVTRIQGQRPPEANRGTREPPINA